MSDATDIRGILATRSVMTFFSDQVNHYSHRVRIVLAEKGVTVEIIDVDPARYPSELAEISPYMSLPTLVDRELVLFESKIMMEYLDDRFPHPPLMPVYPVARAESRQFMYRIERDWCLKVDAIENPRTGDKVKNKARQELRDELIAVAPLFAENPYFMNEEFSLVDCCIAPILWRLPSLGVKIPDVKPTKPLHDYMSRLFTRESFRASLTERERELRS